MAVIKNIQGLHKALAAVAPIDGVSGDGTIWFQAGANQGQKTAAQNILNAFADNPADPSVGQPGPAMQTLPQPKPITSI